MNNFIQMLNPSQYSQLMSMLNTHLIEARVSSDVASSSNPIKGTCLTIPIYTNLHPSRYWIVDSGATSHICYSQHLFSSMKLVQDAYVTLPDKSKIPIHFVGIVKLSNRLILTDVLYVL